MAWIAAELAADRARERAGEHRLADAGHALQQQVAVGEQADGGGSTASPLPAITRSTLPDQTAERRGRLADVMGSGWSTSSRLRRAAPRALERPDALRRRGASRRAR